MNPLRLITVKILKKKKKRTLMTILSIALATFLMIGVSVVFSSYRENDIKQYIASYGDYHVAIRKRSYEDLEILKQDKEIKQIQPFFLLEQTVHETSPMYIVGTNLQVLKDISLKEGTLPTKEKEVLVSKNFLRIHHYEITVGDTFTTQNGTFKIVGVYEENYYVDFLPYPDGEIVLTFFENPTKEMETSFLITFKEVKNALQKYEKIGLALGETPTYGIEGATFESLTPNYGLLAKYGETFNKTSENLKIGVILILTTVIGIITSFVIYNSFAVSVLERKKQYGMMRSIGATKGQIFGSVFFEAFLVGILGISLGMVLLLIFGNLLIFGINTLQKDILVIPYTLELYPLYYYITLFGIVLVIIISAYFPAKRSSEITPLQAIRSNQDIKIPKSITKSGTWLGKRLGIEAMLAKKNRTRNKKRYRTSTIALILSIMILFLGSVFFDALYETYQRVQDSYQSLPYISLSLTTKKEEDLNQIYSELKKLDGTESVFQSSNFITMIDGDLFGNLTEEFQNRYPNQIKGNVKTPVFLILLGQENYEDLQKLYHLKDGQILFFNTFFDTDGKEISIFELGDSFDYTFCKKEEELCTFEIKDIKVMKEQLQYIKSGPSLMFAIPREMGKEFRSYSDTWNTQNEFHQNYYIETEKYMEFNEKVESILQKYEIVDFSITNERKDMEETRIQILMYQYSAYAVAAFFLLIAFMSVSTSITASMEGRRKEYAILRSVGMTEKEFSKMIFIESLLFSMKAFLYSFLFSNILLFVINAWMKAMQPGVTNPIQIQYPWISLLISMVLVFLVFILNMFVSLNSMKKDNLIDIIKEDSY